MNMEIVKVKPFTNGVRARIKIKKNLLLKDSSFMRKLQNKKIVSFGRSLPIYHKSAWHRQRGAKRLYRNVSYSNRPKLSVVICTLYNPNKSNFLSLNFDITNKKFYYDTSVLKITSGALVQTKKNLLELKLGFRTILSSIPAGTLINNVSLPKEYNSTYIRSAGTSGQLIQVGKDKSKIKLPSGKIIEISSSSSANLGTNDNVKHNLINLGKAGVNRNKGFRPIVRGIAMNPVDHPHGGRTNGGRPSVTPWGLPTKSKFRLRKK